MILTQDFGENPLAVSERENEIGIPQGFALLQNSPNPFDATTSLHFALPQAGRVQIEVFDLLGRFITEVVNDQFVAGRHALTVHPHLERSGVYFYRLTVQQGGRIVYRQTRKLLFMP